MSSPVERESLEVDVLFVGAGPATLASALHLMNQVESYNARAGANGEKSIEPPTVLVIEKAANVGDHMLSGAVVNPRGIRELMPDFEAQGFPTEYICDKPMTYVFLGNQAIRLPVNLPEFQKKGRRTDRRPRGHTGLNQWDDPL